MATTLYEILAWARQNGEPKVVERIRVFVLPITMEEKIRIAEVTPDTTCSDRCLDAIRQAAARVIGKPCPY